MKAQLRRINTSLLQLTGSFLFGVLWGTLLSFHSATPSGVADMQRSLSPVSLFWLPALAFLLGTSVIGYWLIPLLAVLRGYMLSASFAILLRGGVEIRLALIIAALPALFSVPAFFLLCEEAVSSSRILCLCSESGLMRSCGYIRPARLSLSLILLMAAAGTQIYLVPQIV